jgi:hypothetical protein
VHGSWRSWTEDRDEIRYLLEAFVMSFAVAPGCVELDAITAVFARHVDGVVGQ